MKRAIVIVLDSLGIGALPDAEKFGDAGCNTLAHVLESATFYLPNLRQLGLGNLLFDPILPPATSPSAFAARLGTLSPGKDTLTGHWEMMGLPQAEPFPTYPQGFPTAVIAEIERISGRPVLGNIAASGTEIIQRLGDIAVRQGALIVYTSADSVLQIAAHEQVIAVDELYHICAVIHDYLLGTVNKVARVIARPFIGENGRYIRTERRHDFSAKPSATLLNLIEAAGGKVLAVGKIVDIFAGQGISQSFRTKNNQEGISVTIRLIQAGNGNLIFTNLVDFDMLYGHRNDPIGYGRALEEFDRSLPTLLTALQTDDLLVITADHGCDPTSPSTDHSREYVPCLVYHLGMTEGRQLADQPSQCAVGSTVAKWLTLPELDCGSSLLEVAVDESY